LIAKDNEIGDGNFGSIVIDHGAESGENAQLNRDHVAQMRGEKLAKVIVT